MSAKKFIITCSACNERNRVSLGQAWRCAKCKRDFTPKELEVAAMVSSIFESLGNTSSIEWRDDNGRVAHRVENPNASKSAPAVPTTTPRKVVITCCQCHTKNRAPVGPKVRCAKCKRLFSLAEVMAAANESRPPVERAPLMRTGDDGDPDDEDDEDDDEEDEDDE